MYSRKALYVLLCTPDSMCMVGLMAYFFMSCGAKVEAPSYHSPKALHAENRGLIFSVESNVIRLDFSQRHTYVLPASTAAKWSPTSSFKFLFVLFCVFVQNNSLVFTIQ